ncbi:MULTISPECIES: chemotaxis protein CheB [Pseudomonas]|uniref:protein-glutamate methylesterase n=1 Tax=Pseudomonas lutea TaxID=243924 RepID=A0A9X8ME56_9PSED|nr:MULTISPECIES: chemotaxis protein CheB [Pseudomonas]MDN3237111.1 chemotaxis protein CheB [Pseudomonas sp. WAC2]RRW44459.1 chemotaxis protein CheB [Pseudomonas luteola]SEQ83236.1 two-component system, chemotaxis family, response regulator CheB [Pseudomonas lutea]
MKQGPDTLFSLPQRQIEAIVVGASAGGLQALSVLLVGLVETFRLPIVVVVHMPEDKDSKLAEIFRLRLEIDVKEADEKEPLHPGTLYFAPPGYHLLIEQDKTLSLSREERVHFSRPSIDVLFESAADVFGEHLCGVLLTGANEDGAAGLRAIHRAGGLTVVQDPAEAFVPTMPEAALKLFTPDFVLPVRDINTLLVELEQNNA